MPDIPDPTAAELARVVAWLRARAEKLDKVECWWLVRVCDALRIAAYDLARGEQP